MENENKEYLKFAKEIAYEAGKIMLRYFNQDKVQAINEIKL